MGEPASLRTVYLGQFEHEHAEAIAEALEEGGIPWTYKQFGRLTRLFFAGDWGVRIFVDATRIEDAKLIVERLMGEQGGNRQEDRS